MTELLFIRILNMSLTGSLVILAVLAMRPLLRKAPGIFSYCLWGVVLFRLLCPISFSAVFSPLNVLPALLMEQGRIEYIPEELLQVSQSTAQPVTPIANNMIGAAPQETAITAGTGTISSTGLLMVMSEIWLAGILIMAIYSIITFLRLTGKLKTASWYRDNIYITETVSTPFVIGLIRPRIYLPAMLGEHEMHYILLHEQIHLKRRDHIVKIISYMTLCLHWFNPLVWAAFFLSGKDMEMSCDEAVIRKIGSGVKKEYTTSLLCLSTGKRIVNGIPLAFGEGDTGSRIKNVLRYKKPASLVMGIAAVVCTVTAVILMANPDKPENDGGSITYYGVIMDVAVEGSARRLLVVPNWGEIEIPEAKTIDTWFEPGNERDPHELLPGDLAAVTFSSEEDAAIQETWPARFSGTADNIVIMWQGLSLQNIGDGSKLFGSTYLLTFPGGAVPEVSSAETGDMLSLYWEDPEDDAYLLQIPESDQSRLIASTPILAITENETGGRMLTVGLNTPVVSQMLGGFGFHIRFALEPGEFLTQEDRRAAEEASAYLTDQNRQEPDGSSASSEGQSDRGTISTAPAEFTESGGSITLSADIFTVNIRSVARSSRLIDIYLPSGYFPYSSEEPLAFAEDCVFRVNYSMDSVDYREVSFDTFASLIEKCSHHLNKPCVLACEDGLVKEARLESAWLNYGISFDTFVPNTYQYEYFMTSWLESCHLILSTQDGELRTEKVSEADKYNYETLSLKDREL